jgi:hypothetical protein
MKLQTPQEALDYLNNGIHTQLLVPLQLIGANLGETTIVTTFQVRNNGGQTFTAWQWDMDGLPLIKFGQGHWLFDDGRMRICSIDDVNKELYARAPGLQPVLSTVEKSALTELSKELHQDNHS